MSCLNRQWSRWCGFGIALDDLALTAGSRDRLIGFSGSLRSERAQHGVLLRMGCLMNSMWVRLNFLGMAVIALLLVAVLAQDAYGGPLDPPGAPGSTDGVRGPGTPISSLPYTISQPGYYSVTRHLIGPDLEPGITITTSNVTLDLGGFTLLGGSSAGDGIAVSGHCELELVRGDLRTTPRSETASSQRTALGSALRTTRS